MKIRQSIAVLALVFILIAVNAAIFKKEHYLEQGQMVLLELAPRDTRSLMQGDYMALRFTVAEQLRDALPKKSQSSGWWRKVDAEDGWVLLKVDPQGVGHFAGVTFSAPDALQPRTRPGPEQGSDAKHAKTHMAFRVRNGTVRFATNAFFFQEGTAALYEQARYGEFRLNDAGEPLLVALRDDNFARLGSRAAAD